MQLSEDDDEEAVAANGAQDSSISYLTKDGLQ